MRTSRVIALPTVLLGLVLAACSGDVASSDEYLAIEAELASAVEAQGEAATLLEEAQSELATKQTAVEEAQDQAREAQATAAQSTERAEEAEAALDEVMNAEWPDAVRSEFINGCAAESDVGGEADGEAIAFCTCTFDHLQSSMSLVDFFVFSIEAGTSEGDVNLFGVPADMDPEFLSAFTDATVACVFDSSANASKSAHDLAVGDCFADPPSFDEINDVATSPCSQPHDNEVYAAVEMPGDTWPEEETVPNWSDETCADMFEAYVGTRWEASSLDYWYLFPLEESWVKDDDRTVTCVLFDANYAKLTGSMQGSGI